MYLGAGTTVLKLWSQPYRAKNEPCRAKKQQKLKTNLEIDVLSKTVFFTILNGIWEVWGCPGAWHGPYDAIPSNFGGVWSYMAWGKSFFMFFGNIGNSLHHQIPPNWSSDFFESQGTISGAIKPIVFQQMTPTKKNGNLEHHPKIVIL